MGDSMSDEMYLAEGVDAPHALLSRIRAAKEARGEHRVQGAAGRKIIKDFGRAMKVESGPKVRRFSSENGVSQLGGYSEAGPSSRDPQSLAGLLNRVIMERGWTTPLAVSSVLARWDQIAGPSLACKAIPETFEGGVLTVRCESTAWAVQVRQMKYDIMRRFNSELGDEIVTDVRAFGPTAPSWKKGRRVAPGGRGPRDTYG
ncbi:MULTISPECIES: DUF721 domain-containing protein [Rothia]|uniref:DUF721 domain-containing protein n=2 Tax=Rothia TaxID=32207 RepID=A0A1Y1RQ30_9MICC|nr:MULTISPECIES: DciA family protein [Rothia]ORC20214.1 hypothetical protein A7979_11295 [Rothia nasimurium]